MTILKVWVGVGEGEGVIEYLPSPLIEQLERYLYRINVHALHQNEM